MLNIQSDPETLASIKDRISQRHPQISFGGNLRLGKIEIGLDKDTAEFVIAVIDAVRKERQKNVQVDIDDKSTAKSGITREFLNGYFRRR